MGLLLPDLLILIPRSSYLVEQRVEIQKALLSVCRPAFSRAESRDLQNDVQCFQVYYHSIIFQCVTILYILQISEEREERYTRVHARAICDSRYIYVPYLPCVNMLTRMYIVHMYKYVRWRRVAY